MDSIRRSMRTATLAALFAAALLLAAPHTASADDDGFDEQYIFATTKAVNNMDINPALKLTIYPVTIVLDTVFLPFAVIAGFVG